MNFRTRLMIPPLVFTILLTSIILFIFISQQLSFKEKQKQRTAQRELSVRNLFHRRLQETRSFVELTNHNSIIINGVLVDDQGKVLDAISPFSEKATINFLNIYTLNKIIFAETEYPSVFGKSDDLKPWLDKVLNAENTISTIYPVNQKIALLSGGKLQSLNETIGFTVAGYYLDKRFLQDLATASGVDLALMKNGVTIISSLPGDIPPSYQVTTVSIHESLDNAVDFSLVLLENNTIDANQFYIILVTCIGTISIAGFCAIGFSIRATKSITHSHHQLQTEVAERRRTEEVLKKSQDQLQQQTQQLEKTLNELQKTQSQLIQTEKMSALGHLVAGIAHEINNPISFIYGNISPAQNYMHSLINIVKLYQESYPTPHTSIQNAIDEIDLDFIIDDLPKIFSSMSTGANRVRQIVLSLRNFSHMDEVGKKTVDIHQGIESTLLILQNRLISTAKRLPIQIIKQYSTLPLVECYPGQINQVFLGILNNAIDVLEERFTSTDTPLASPQNPTIWITTETLSPNQVTIRIRDNGSGMSETVKENVFNPFFTTKPVGQGTGMGMAISYQIITDNHNGSLQCFSSPGGGAEFVIQIPIYSRSQE